MNVEDGVEVNGRRDGKDKVEGDADLGIDLSEARDSEGEAQVAEQVDGLGNTSGSIEGHLKVCLDAAQVDLDRWGQEEVIAAGYVDRTLEGGFGESKPKLDSLSGVGSSGDDTVGRGVST